MTADGNFTAEVAGTGVSLHIDDDVVMWTKSDRAAS